MDLPESSVLEAEAMPAVGSEPAIAPAAMLGDGAENLSGVLLEPRSWHVISPDRPLAMFNSPHAEAYHAQLRADPSRPLIALLCRSNLPQRVDVMDALRGFNLAGMLKIVDWGMMDWPLDNKRRFVVIMERPGGARVMPSLKIPQPPLNEDELVRGLLQPLLPTLRDFQIRGITHRGIRPDNLFFNDAGVRSMVLGEGVTAPPGYDQPAVFETIESSMSDITGRGNGNISNDLYSLGVTLLFLLLGGNPRIDIDPQKLLDQKIEHGSYATLVGQVRVPLSLMEALRGLLSDDTKERWTVNDLDMWLSGRRLSPKQPKLPQRASRPFPFQGHDYYNARSLAVAFARHFQEAAPLMRSKSLDSWLRRSLSDEIRANALMNAVSSTASHISGRGNEDRLVARGCIALDPMAPLRYRGFGVMMDGVGPALSAGMEDRERRQLVSEIIASRLAIQWIMVQTKPRPEELRALQTLEKLPSIIEQTAVGFGVERCLYELNPAERCQSPIFDDIYVTDIGEIIPALEAAVIREVHGNTVLDRHIVAFIAARTKRPIDNLLKQLAASDSKIRSLGVLRMLATIQEMAGGPPAPALSHWLAKTLGVAITSFHHKTRRERMSERLERAAETGMLRELIEIIDDATERGMDAGEFAEAVAEYRAITGELDSFETNAAERREDKITIGEQIAAVLAGLLVSVVSAAVVLLRFM